MTNNPYLQIHVNLPTTTKMIAKSVLCPGALIGFATWLIFACGSSALAESPSIATSSTDDYFIVEAESFDELGGWKLDTQFVDNMGSPYLLAHGLGKPVKDATKKVEFPVGPSKFHVFVRTKDWTAPWKSPESPGKFRIQIGDQQLEKTFGTNGPEWDWQYGGEVSVENRETTLTIKDLTGFDGRCDAIAFCINKTPPPNDNEVLTAWRKKRLGTRPAESVAGNFDLVVIGGGYSGMGAAISAARAGCKVALIQNRGVLGGNGSSEVRVWAMGLIRRGKYPRVGEIIEEFCDHATKSPGTYEEFEDAKKEAIVRAEPNLSLFLNHHAFRVESDSTRIKSIYAVDTRSGQPRIFHGKLFCDCTGHGTIGFLAGADWEMTPKGRMGMSNMWAWDEGDSTVDFPETPWALDLEMQDFPYPRDHHGQWFWESGFDQDPLKGAELIRDWNLRAVYGAFNAMKNRGGAAKHKNAFLTWVAYVGGTRESRRLLGDVILNQEDVVSKREFKDGCVPSTWSIDLHYPKKQFAKKFPENPFISIAKHDRRIDRAYGYPVPYRCFYSRNIENLFMAGRCISVTHEALGTTRVMKTCGMMGEVVGRAASICTKHQCLPRDVYAKYWDEMNQLLNLPGKAHRPSVNEEFIIPKDAMSLATSSGPMIGKNPKLLSGIVVDNRKAKTKGSWTRGTNLKGFVAHDYIYAAPDSDASVIFEPKAIKPGTYEVRVAYQPHQNRGTAVPIRIESDSNQLLESTIDMTKAPNSKNGFQAVTKLKLKKGEVCKVTLSTQKSGGVVHADAVQLVPVN